MAGSRLVGLRARLWWSEASFPDFSSEQGWTRNPVLDHG